MIPVFFCCTSVRHVRMRECRWSGTGPLHLLALLPLLRGALLVLGEATKVSIITVKKIGICLFLKNPGQTFFSWTQSKALNTYGRYRYFTKILGNFAFCIFLFRVWTFYAIAAGAEHTRLSSAILAADDHELYCPAFTLKVKHAVDHWWNIKDWGR